MRHSFLHAGPLRRLCLVVCSLSSVSLAKYASSSSSSPSSSFSSPNGSEPLNGNAAHAAVDAMMGLYNATDGIWGGDPWWQSGVALRAVTEYMLASGSSQYLAAAEHTVAVQSAPLDWWPQGGGDFRADSTDDTGWWALALTSLYQLTGNETYLAYAKEDEAYMWAYWNASTCGGGLLWSVRNLSYHNAISNELYLELTATLHNLIPGDAYYLNQSLVEWAWFEGSGMLNADHLINDGLTEDAACVNNRQPTWTYNQGVVLAGLAQLYRATGNATLLEVARGIADAVVASPRLSPGGVLTEPCDTPAECEPNGTAFKGIFIRGLWKLDALLAGHPYRAYILNNTVSAYNRDRNASGYYDLPWQGPFVNSSIGKQESAVYLLMAATFEDGGL